MREIKFRAWDKRENRWRGMWIFRGGHITEQRYYDEPEIFDLSSYFKDCVLMQFTGLKDKNGKEICEGDIVKYHDDFYTDPADIGGRKHIVRDRLYIIWWHPLKAAFWLKSVPGAITESLWSLDCEVIGNVHENPELVKGA